MSTPPDRLCPRCEAKIPIDAARCWLCGLSLPVQRVEAPIQKPAAELVYDVQVVQEASATFSLTSLFLLMTMIAVGFGLFAIAPGLGILLGIAAVPALIRTTLVAHRRTTLGRETSTARKILLFVGSVAATVVMAIVVIVAAIGSFCAVCLTVATQGAIPVAATVAITVGLGTVALLVMWVVARYSRDVNAR